MRTIPLAALLTLCACSGGSNGQAHADDRLPTLPGVWSGVMHETERGYDIPFTMTIVVNQGVPQEFAIEVDFIDRNVASPYLAVHPDGRMTIEEGRVVTAETLGLFATLDVDPGGAFLSGPYQCYAIHPMRTGNIVLTKQ